MFSIPFFTRKEIIALPQYDKANGEERELEIAAQKAEYRWTTNGIGDAPFIDGLPCEEYPKLGWVEEVIKIVLRVLLNKASVESDNIGDGSEARGRVYRRIASFSAKVFRKLLLGQVHHDSINESLDVLSSVTAGHVQGKGLNFQEYKDLFKVFKLDRIAKFDQFLRDDIFGWYRVAGPNPMRITKLSTSVADMFPELTDDILRGIPDFSCDSLQELEMSNRLFFADFKELDGIPQGKLPDGTLKDNFYLYAPTALFAVPKNPDTRTSVLPIAIRCGQGNKKYPMYTPNKSHTDQVTWLAAKLTVQVADAITMEAIYHLGRCHLLIEVFVCSMHRCLAPTHPVAKFLKIHFYGTAFINYLAVDTLTSPGGSVDVISAPQIETTALLASRSINQPSFQFNEWFPDKELANRGVLNAHQLQFPYRDDSLKIWKAINQWIRSYLGSYYRSDEDVKNDTELRDWCHEIVAPGAGSVHGFGETKSGEILTFDYLSRMISMLVFTATAQHAAVNFTQSSLMQFVPAMPLAGTAPAPVTRKPFKSIDHWIEEMMPDLQTTLTQMNTAELIGVIRFTTLGEYGKDLSFVDDDVRQGLEEFQENLGRIGAEIQERNKEERRVGLPIYDMLVPKNIPQSTNI